MGLQEYKRKRDFKKTPEPAGKVAKAKGSSFVIQKHAATRLHYDFRLEMEGVLRSWAVPKGPSLDPGEKRLAVHVEDHPLDYGDFEGVIPKGEYGGGTVLLWDHGTWYPDIDPVKAYRKGHIKFRLEGEKLHGGWHLVRLQGKDEDKENWLLFKENDEFAVAGSGDAVVQEYPASVTTGLTLEEIAANPDRVWKSNREKAAPPGARKAKLPAKVAPQLATLVSDPPKGAEWIHELKLDGYRVLCELKDGKVRVITRNGKEWTDLFGPVAEAISLLPAKEALLDGEASVLLPNGTTSFQALQNALGKGGKNILFFAFDLLHLDGYDLRPVPLLQRKETLAALLAGQPKEGTIRLSDHVEGSGDAFYQHACNYGLEGIISKRADLPYHSGRSKEWVKVKCLKRQEMVIAGFTDPEGSRRGFGALLLAVNEGKELVYAGKVGTGFNAKTLLDLRKKLGKLERKTPAFKKAPRGAEARRSHWVEPKLVAEVAFTEWTEDGILRHPTFQGLREDKSPGEVVREVAQPIEKVVKKVVKKPAKRAKKGPKKGDTPPLGPERDPEGVTEIAGVKLSNPDRVLYPDQGLTKRELALFYERIQAWILPHLKNRPLTLVRCPSGQGKQCFYQKHVSEQFPASIKRVKVEEGAGAEPYGALDSVTGLITLVQMGVLELHIWGSHLDDIEKPDYIVFDLDPDEGLSWERVVEGTLKVREKLEGLGLRTWLKTTGGKGLHVCVPITRRGEWDEVKAFTKAVVESIVTDEPNRYTSKLPKASRKGKIFIDYLRNGRGATSIAAYSTRARPGAPVSTPLFWEELETDVRANTYNVRNLPERLESLEADPWADFLKERQSITAAMKKAVGMK